MSSFPLKKEKGGLGHGQHPTYGNDLELISCFFWSELLWGALVMLQQWMATVVPLLERSQHKSLLQQCWVEAPPSLGNNIQKNGQKIQKISCQKSMMISTFIIAILFLLDPGVPGVRSILYGDLTDVTLVDGYINSLQLMTPINSFQLRIYFKFKTQ